MIYCPGGIFLACFYQLVCRESGFHDAVCTEKASVATEGEIWLYHL
jgi:hypothetical protein